MGKDVDTPEGKSLFHATAMSVCQRQPTMDVRAYLTASVSYLPPTIIIDDMAVVHELNVHKSNCQDHSAFFIRAIDNKSFACEAY